MAQLQNKQNRDQQYLAVRVGRAPQPIVDDTEVYKAESADYIEDICPYATFQLSKPVYSESSYSGNVYSGPYHPVRGSFVYHDVKPPPFDKLKLGHVSSFSSSEFAAFAHKDPASVSGLCAKTEHFFFSYFHAVSVHFLFCS